MDDLYSLVAAATVLPVSVNECKADLRIDSAEEDDLIESYILAASKLSSEIVGRKLINESWLFSLRSGACEIEMPFTPISSLTSIQYWDSDNVTQTLNVADFYVRNFDTHTTIEPVDTFTWPAFFNRRDALNITFVAGFGATGANVPDTIKRAIRLTVAHWYENRTAVLVGVTANELPIGVQSLLNVERTGWIG